jgi:mRNA-degrading endonuclease RelE of RelBE toxin-antitoxin system
MNGYQVHLTRSAEKDIQQLGSNKDQQKVIHLLKRLEKQPDLGQPLTGALSGLYSLHFSLSSGQARIIYTIIHDKFVILIIALGPRENIYTLAIRRNKT